MLYNIAGFDSFNLFMCKVGGSINASVIKLKCQCWALHVYWVEVADESKVNE